MAYIFDTNILIRSKNEMPILQKKVNLISPKQAK